MKRRIKCLLLVLIVFLVSACSETEISKIINKTYIEKNNGVVFSNYAIALDEENNDGKTYAIFEKINTERYKKLFVLDTYSTKDRILCTDDVVYLFGNNGGIVGYNLDTYKKIEMITSDEDSFILSPVEIYGYYDGNIYVSFNKDKKINYALIDEDLDSYEEIEKDMIPEEFEYSLVKR